VLSSDDQVEKYAAENSLTYSQAIAKIDMKTFERIMTSDLRAAVASDSDIIVDRTNVRLRARNRWLSQVPKHYFRVCLLFEASKEVLEQRLIERAKTTGKHVPKNILKDMIEMYQEPTLAEFDTIKKVDF
jgi:hypothetical protein